MASYHSGLDRAILPGGAMKLAELRSRDVVVAFLVLSGGCEAAELPAPAREDQRPDVSLKEQALVCLRGPAFPSCYGNCGFLDCSPIDPGACCSCDTGCVARGDCCCDFEYECVHDPLDTCSTPLPPAETQEHVKKIAATSGAVYIAGTRARPAAFAGDMVDGFLRRLDPLTLLPVWDRSIDNCFWDRIEAVATLPGGDVIVAGSTRDGPFGPTNTRPLVRRYTSAGGIVWQVSPSSPSGAATLAAVAISPVDESIVVAGAVSTAAGLRPLVARFNALGDLLWMRTVTGIADDLAKAIAVSTSDRIAIITGAGSTAKTALLSATGTLQWAVSEGANTTGVDVAFDGSEIVALSRVRDDVVHLSRLARYKGTGVQRFARVIDLGGVRRWNPASGLALTAAGDAIVSGDYAQVDGTIRAFLARYSATGVLSWSRVRATPTLSQTVDLALVGTSALTAAQETPVIRPIVLRDAL